MNIFPKKEAVINAVLLGIENAKETTLFGLVMNYIYLMHHQNFYQFM